MNTHTEKPTVCISVSKRLNKGSIVAYRNECCIFAGSIDSLPMNKHFDEVTISPFDVEHLKSKLSNFIIKELK